MNYVSLRQLAHDVRAWSGSLPDGFVAVAGVPRSGILPAAQLALQWNIHLVNLRDLMEGRRPWSSHLRRGVAAKAVGPVLIVDDSIHSGRTIKEISRRLEGLGHFVYGALYYVDHVSASLVNYRFRHVSAPRCFEWNLFHCQQMRYACVDMDGVLCEDWPHREEDDGPRLNDYLRHLRYAKPLFRPRSFPLMAVVTSRLEKYRRLTEIWLERNRVQYGQLVMSPFQSAAERQTAALNGELKARFYNEAKGARLFIESDPSQARIIAETTGRPVICARTMELC